jgi:uncharacterized protein
VAPAAIDHHVHILGDDVLRDWQALGIRFSRPLEVYRSAQSLLGKPGPLSAESTVEKAVLVPMAHLYGSEDFLIGLKLDLAEEQARVARENDHVAREAARYPGRAVALCSVPALRSYAIAELERCHGKNGSAGIKLHLASSGVDLRDENHLKTVAELAAWAEKKGLAILLHVDTQRRGTTVEHVKRLIKVVFVPHPDLKVLVAHLGGSGGYGRWTRSMFLTIQGWLEQTEKNGGKNRSVFFDVSAVLLEEESEGVPATSAEEARQLAVDLRRFGFERIVFGTDYPVFDARRATAALVSLAGLSQAEIEGLMRRSPPGLFGDR